MIGPTIRAVLFDASGTLIRLRPPAPLLRTALRDEGFTHPEARVAAALRAEIAYYLAHHHEASDDRTLQALRRECASILGDALGGHHPPTERLAQILIGSLQFELFPDVHPTLDGLSARGLLLAVVSNWDCGLLDVLAGLGVADRFAAIVPSADVGVPKPQPAVFEAALRRLRVEPSEAIHVGDRPETDAAGAAAAGIGAVTIDRRVRARQGSISSLVALLEGPR